MGFSNFFGNSVESRWRISGKIRLGEFGNYGIHSTESHSLEAYQVPACTAPRSPILLRLVCGRTSVATLGMWADPPPRNFYEDFWAPLVGFDLQVASKWLSLFRPPGVMADGGALSVQAASGRVVVGCRDFLTRRLTHTNRGPTTSIRGNAGRDGGTWNHPGTCTRL